MKSTQIKGREWPSVMFSRIDVESPQRVAEFIVWLCTWGIRLEPIDDETHFQIDPELDEELMWGWNGARKKRMAKLLWQLLVGNYSEDYFDQWFTIDAAHITKQIDRSLSQLTPIKENLQWVLDGKIAREREDATIGQGDWGEAWWLPENQATYMRQQIRRAHSDLIEESSAYEDALKFATLPYFEIECEDPNRIYLGSISDVSRNFVEIKDSNDDTAPLHHAWHPFQTRAGTNFSWGSPGAGPSSLAVSIVADAVGGDLQIAERLRSEFVDEVLRKFPQGQPFQLSRHEVLAWASTKGVGTADLNLAAKRVAGLKKTYGSSLSELKGRLKSIREKGGLVTQRFDLVPEDFECALYVDLMRNLERTGRVLRCNRCNHPLSCPPTPTGNRQRARWVAGRPVYHEECFFEHRREHQRKYWKERAKDPEFRDRERDRARKRRKAL